MSFDALTLSAVRDELEPLLVDARIQKLVFVDELSLALEAFAPNSGRTHVLLSADLERGRIQRIAQLSARGLERDTPFSLVIRKHLRNARIRGLSQPRLERLLQIDCEQRDASGRLYRLLLIVEAMGRRSNLVLVDEDGAIIDAARRAPPSRNAKRPLLPHLPYAPPPPQGRRMPEEITADSLRADGATPLAKLLAERVAGLSPLAAREVAFRAESNDLSRVATVVRQFMAVADTHAWEPSVALEGDRPIEFAPYELRHLAAAGAQLQRFESISAAMEAYYARPAAPRGDPLSAERKALLAPLERAAHTAERRIAALSHQLETSRAGREPLRLAGEAILTHQSELPLGSTELVVDGERVELDPTLSAVANAQAYFGRYRKAREAEERVPELLEAARQSAEHLADLRTLVEVADHMDAIRALRREVAAATATAQPAARRQSKQPKKSAPYQRVNLGDGWEALVGTSAEGNAAVTFDVAGADDLWLHARGAPGAHVVLRTNSARPPAPIVERAAQLAAHHSAVREATAVEVDVTPRRHVKKVPNGPPGLVRYSNETTLRVSPHLG